MLVVGKGHWQRRGNGGLLRLFLDAMNLIAAGRDSCGVGMEQTDGI